MQAYIVTTFIGVFAVDEDKKVLAHIPFPRDPKAAAESFKKSEVEIIEQEKQLYNQLIKKKYKVIYGYKKPGVRYAERNNIGESFVKDNLRKLAMERNIFKDQTEFNQFLTNVNLALTKVKIKTAAQRDSLVINAISAIEELDKATNIFAERLREWYGLHFPELDRAVNSHEKFAKLITKFGSRESLDDPELNKLKENSMGIDITESDVQTIQKFSGKILELYQLREGLLKYTETVLKEVAPNFTEIAGPLLAAKLIAKAGGLDKLARMPSSTIQLLGAEKALFRFLHSKDKTGSPKYGIIFSHQLIQNSPPQHRGKVARLLASKLSIAAKLDFYKGENKGEQMKKELQERVKEVLSAKK